MEIYVVRHGRAEPAGAGSPDAERALTTEGAREIEQVAEALARLGVRPDRILTSPRRRALQTASLLSAGLGGPPPEVWPSLGGEATAAEILGELEGAGACVAVIGHEPTAGELVALACGGAGAARRPLRPGGVACIRVTGAPRPGAGQLVWLRSPQELLALPSGPRRPPGGG